MNNRILLINPSVTYLERMEPIRLPQPVGICYVAAYLEKTGYEVKLLDAHCEGYENRHKIGDRTQVGLDEAAIAKEVADFDPAVVGVSGMFTDQYKNAHMACRAVKSVSPDIITIG